MAQWYCGSVEYTAVAQWASLHVYAAGAIVRQLAAPSLGNERCFRTTSGGTSGVSEPSWNLTKGATTTDATVTWTEVTGNSTYNWSAPAARIGNATSSNWIAAGDTVFVSEDHSESTAGATWQISASANAPVLVVCVTHSGSVPPVSADLRTTALVTITGGNQLTILGTTEIYGVNMTVGANNNIGNCLNFGTNSQSNIWLKNSAIIVVGSNNQIELGNPSSGNPHSSYIVWDNVSVQWNTSSNGNYVEAGSTFFEWKNTSTPVTGTIGNIAAGFVINQALGSGDIYIHGVDFSALGTTGPVAPAAVASSRVVAANCRLSTTFTAPAAATFAGGMRIDYQNCDDSTSQRNYRLIQSRYEGTLATDATVVRTGGASDGTTLVSHKIATSANSSVLFPFQSMILSVWEGTTGASKTISLYTIANSATALNNNDIWLELETLTNATYPLATFSNNGLADPLATAAAQTTDTSAWDTGATARQNTHAYVVGDVIKVATNAGRVFFCTTAGTTAGSEPGGYATAVDGGSVTDNTAVFRAGMRQVLSVSVTPQMVGYIKAIVYAAKASTTIYIDPLLNGA